MLYCKKCKVLVNAMPYEASQSLRHRNHKALLVHLDYEALMAAVERLVARQEEQEEVFETDREADCPEFYEKNKGK